MKTEDKIAIAFFAVVMSCAVGWAIVGDIASRLCDGVDLAKLNEGRPAFSCGEFWLSRYQTTVQTIISGAIGAAGLYFVLKQLAGLNQQNAMTRFALEANTRQMAAAERGAVGRAKQAIWVHASAAGTLLLQAVAAKAEVPLERVDMNPEAFAKAAASIADVYPALHTIPLQIEWKSLREELEILSAYILARRVDTTGSIDYNAYMAKAPRDLIEAAGRAGALQQRLADFASRIDI